MMIYGFFFFLFLAAIIIWLDRHDVLWDRITSSFSTSWRRHRWFDNEPIRLISMNSKERSWFNAMHIEADPAGLYIGPIVIAWYRKAALIPWSDLEPMDPKIVGISRKFIVQIVPLSIQIAITMKHEKAIMARIEGT